MTWISTKCSTIRLYCALETDSVQVIPVTGADQGTVVLMQPVFVHVNGLVRAIRPGISNHSMSQANFQFSVDKPN